MERADLTVRDTASGRLHGLDHLRALAIILVLFFHYKVYYGLPAWLDGFSAFGWSGVDLFFVLSGFLIGDKLLREIGRTGRISFKGFYLNRGLRIFPAYFAALALYFSFAEVQEGRALQPLWKFLTFTQNISIDLYANTFSHAWSLSVEEYFYLTLPALLYFLFFTRIQNKALYIVLGLLGLGILLRYAIWVEFVDPLQGTMRLRAALKHIYYPTYTRLDGLIVGVAIAAILNYQPRLWRWITKRGYFFLLAGLGLLVASYVLFGGNVLSPAFSSLATTLIGFPLLSIAYGCLVVAALSPSCFLHRFQFGPSAALATLAYAIYLVHKMTNHWLNKNLGNFVTLEKEQLFVVCLVAAVAGGLLLHLAVEKPFLMLRDRLTRRSSNGNARH